jgi:beta-lactamase regulating signal transducer with metallopeptidase domain
VHHVLNWLGQGTLVAMATLVLLRTLSRSKPSTRFAFCWGALLVVLALPWIPSVVAWSVWQPVNDAAPIVPAIAPGALFSLEAAWWTSPAMTLACCAIWSAFFSARVFRALVAVRVGRAACRPFPPEIESRLTSWTSLRGRPARLAISDRVGSAALLGCGSPVIAVAPELVEHLTPDELDRVLVHEWAHVQRRDDILNLVQLMVKAIAGWHPAVWWLDRQLAVEREMACDEVVLALTGSPRTYARSLTKIASLSPVRWARLASLGALSSTGLSRRVARIVGWGNSLSTRSSTAAALAALVLLMFVALALSGLRLVGVSPRVPAFEPAAAAPSTAASAPRSTNVAPIPALTARVPSEPRVRRQVTRPEPPGQPVESVAEPIPAVEQLLSNPQANVSSDVQPLHSAELSSAPLVAAGSLKTASPSGIPGGIRAERPSSERSNTPWSAAAGAGVAIGRGSQKAGVATANFLGRIGKKIGQSF